jgi:hypothetical protein
MAGGWSCWRNRSQRCINKSGGNAQGISSKSLK